MKSRGARACPKFISQGGMRSGARQFTMTGKANRRRAWQIVDGHGKSSWPPAKTAKDHLAGRPARDKARAAQHRIRQIDDVGSLMGLRLGDTPPAGLEHDHRGRTQPLQAPARPKHGSAATPRVFQIGHADLIPRSGRLFARQAPPIPEGCRRSTQRTMTLVPSGTRL
jgi:hypothetical protein